MSKGFVLDTSAIITLIEDEDGAARVENVLREENVWLPWLVLLETYYITYQENDEAEADKRYAMLKQFPVTVLWAASEPVLLTAGRLKAEHQVSLADAIIAAFAIHQEATLLHKDPEFEAIGDQVVLEALPYKV